MDRGWVVTAIFMRSASSSSFSHDGHASEYRASSFSFSFPFLAAVYFLTKRADFRTNCTVLHLGATDTAQVSSLVWLQGLLQELEQLQGLLQELEHPRYLLQSLECPQSLLQVLE